MGASGPNALGARENTAAARGRFHWPTFAVDAMLVSGGALAANILNYIYHFALSRRLGPDAYGSLAALLAITMVAGVVGSAIGTVAMQETARLWAGHRDDAVGPFARRTAAWAIAIAAVIALASLVAAWPLSSYLHITDRLAWIALAVALFAGIVAAYMRGAIQGAHRFGFYAASVVGESSVKLALGIALVAAGLGVGGAMSAVALGLIVGIAIAAVSLFAVRSISDQAVTPARLGLPAGRLTVIYAASMALLFVDTVFAKHALAGVDAGYYTAAGLVARIIPFGVGLIVPLVTPKAVAARHVGRGALRHLLGVTFGAAIGGALLALAVMELWPQALIGLTFGAKFAGAAPLLRLYAIDGALIGVGVLGTSYLAAIGAYGVATWLLAALVVEAAFMSAFGTTGVRLLWIAIAGNALVLPPIGAMVAHSLRDAPQADAPHDAETFTSLPEPP